MDDYEVLQHLLGLENQAADLVDDAQAEADRRVSEGERKNRIQSEEIYTREVEALEAAYMRCIADARDNYKKQLDTYGDGLRTRHVSMESFSALAGKLLKREA